MTNIVPAKEKVPKFASKNHYQGIFEWIVSLPEERETIVELANKLNISRQTIYDILGHEYTKKQVREYFQGLGIRDQREMYDSLKELAKKNPHAQKLWHEYYSVIEPRKEGETGDIIIQIGIINKEYIEGAEYTEE